MADIVNLNRYRKQRDLRDAARTAAENRVRYGRSKVAREKDKSEARRSAKRLDDKRLD
jgi:hypothetical protein